MNRYKLSTLLICPVLVLACGMLHAQNVVTDWTAIESTTIVKTAGNPPAASGVYFAYAAIASYDAVNAIDRRFRPIYFSGRAWGRASAEAAAVAAAHRVLVNYFPGQQTALDQDFIVSLTGIRVSPDAKVAGVLVGEASAAALLAARTGDGVAASVTYTPRSGPGVWEPTPPGFLPPSTPWLGQMRPFTMRSPSQFLPGGPTPLSSSAWERDYTITRLLGAIDSTVRTSTQTEIGIFWTENTAQQYARLFANLTSQHQLSLLDTARFMAILWTGFADAGIGCFNAKYHYGFWRPVTAIPAGGGTPQRSGESRPGPRASKPHTPS